MAQNHRENAGSRHHLARTLRSLRPQLYWVTGLRPSRHRLAPLPLFQCGILLLSLSKGFWPALSRVCGRYPQRPPPELLEQTLDPWLDQVALPLVIHALGGGRDSLPHGLLDGRHSCHYRFIPLLYARESDAVVTLLEELTSPDHVKSVLDNHPPYRRLIYERHGLRLRQMFDQSALPQTEQMIRKTIKQTGLWLR